MIQSPTKIKPSEPPVWVGCDCWTSKALRAWKGLDKALLSIAALLVLIGVFSPPQLVESLKFAGLTLLQLSPYLLLTYLLVAYMKASSMETVITRIFRGSQPVMIVSASLLGALSPLCSCTVIPVVVLLLRARIHLSAICAFWLSSPIISPDMYILTAGVMGFPFANAKMIAAILMGLLAGFSTLAVEKLGMLSQPMSGRLKAMEALNVEVLGDAIDPKWKFWQEPERVAVFKENFRWALFFLTKWLIVAFLLESLMVAYVPASLVGGWLGSGESLWAVPRAILIGVPAYLNGVMAVPFVAGLMANGMAPGAALAFMVAGGVTSIPAMLAVMPLVRPGVFLWYLWLAVSGSALVGYGYQWFRNMMDS